LPATKISSDRGGMPSYSPPLPSLPILLREIQHPIPSFFAAVIGCTPMSYAGSAPLTLGCKS
jgi:hypothetical protein